MQKDLIGKAIGIGAAVAACGALALGGFAAFHGAGEHAHATVYVTPISHSVAAPTQDMAAANSIYDQQEAQAKAAAAQAAADAAAKLAASTPVKKVATTTTPSATGNPKGTPLPMIKETDPNNAQYGQMVIAQDPGTFCAAHSGSTINGVPVCD